MVLGVVVTCLLAPRRDADIPCVSRVHRGVEKRRAVGLPTKVIARRAGVELSIPPAALIV